ncbi:MAG: aspartate kinase [Bacteroidota bacterium]
MRVFKFGGASIKDSDAVVNMANIIKSYAAEPLLVVVSAMAKNTNLLEDIVKKKLTGEDYSLLLKEFISFHYKMVKSLFHEPNKVNDSIQQWVEQLKLNLSGELHGRKLYDSVVVFGELLSSTIVAAYIEEAKWFDARNCIKTDDHHRQANVNWTKTNELITKELINQKGIIITQGFIGSSHEGESTTLGREGSDFSAAIFATCLGAQSVTVWKDVPGILNGDPKRVENTRMFDQLPYKEAAEMTYYGASVIHPKTIKPLANNNIPLYVRSFSHPEKEGTVIHDCDFEPMPTIIIKDKQCLISFKVLDYSFVDEHNLSLIFKELAMADIQINIMQSSAVSFSIAVDNDLGKVEELVKKLKNDFQIRYNTGLQLLTIKNYTKELVTKYQKGSKILLEQMSRNNYRSLIAPKY